MKKFARAEKKRAPARTQGPAEALAAKIKEHEDAIRASDKEKEEDLAARTAAELLAKRKAAEAEKEALVWSLEEVSALAAGMKKFVGGSVNRWEHVTEVVNAVPGSNRSVKEVIRRAKEANLPVKHVEKEEAYEQYQKQMLRGMSTAQRSALMEAMTPEQRAELKKREADLLHKKSEQETGKEQEIVLQKKERSASTKSEKGRSASTKSENTEWTADEQAALEKALRTVPKGEDRWDNIAKAVGRSKKQCVRRFKEIRAQILASK